MSDVSFIEELANLDVIKLQDSKHVIRLPNLSKHSKLKRIILIDTGINVEQLPKEIQRLISK